MPLWNDSEWGSFGFVQEPDIHVDYVLCPFSNGRRPKPLLITGHASKVRTYEISLSICSHRSNVQWIDLRGEGTWVNENCILDSRMDTSLTIW